MSYNDNLTGFNPNAARVGVTGAVRRAPLGTATPILSPSHKYSDAFSNLGYLSPDGVEISFDEDKQEFTPWQELAPIRQDITKSAKTIKLTLWEFTQGNSEIYFGLAQGSVKQDPETGVWSFYEESVPQFERSMYVLDVVDNDAAMRLTVFNAQVSSRDAIVLKRDEMVGLTVELAVYPASAQDYDDENVAGKTTFWQFTDTWGGSVRKSSQDGSSPLVISTTDLPGGTVDQPYSATLAATGGSGSYTWTTVSGTLPDGVTLSAGGVLSGTPTAAGTSEVRFQVQDSENLLATADLTIDVQ